MPQYTIDTMVYCHQSKPRFQAAARQPSCFGTSAEKDQRIHGHPKTKYYTLLTTEKKNSKNTQTAYSYAKMCQETGKFFKKFYEEV